MVSVSIDAQLTDARSIPNMIGVISTAAESCAGVGWIVEVTVRISWKCFAVGTALIRKPPCPSTRRNSG